MIDYKKRIIIVNDKCSLTTPLKGSVKIVKENDIVKFYADFIIKNGFNYLNYGWILCGESEIVSKNMPNACRFSENLQSDFAFYNGASFLIFDKKTSEIICYGEYGIPLLDFNGITKYAKKNCENIEKNNEKTPSSSRRENSDYRYDDEIIATENYYKINENEILFNQAFDVKSQTQKQETKKENEKLSLFNEESFSCCQNYEYYEKVKDKLNELFSSHERQLDLNKIIKNGDFIKVCYDNNRFYYVGLIKNQNTPEYICYGVNGEYGKVPNNFEKDCFFIPKSPFDLSKEGYYFIFQSVHTGEIVKK